MSFTPESNQSVFILRPSPNGEDIMEKKDKFQRPISEETFQKSPSLLKPQFPQPCNGLMRKQLNGGLFGELRKQQVPAPPRCLEMFISPHDPFSYLLTNALFLIYIKNFFEV